MYNIVSSSFFGVFFPLFCFVAFVIPPPCHANDVYAYAYNSSVQFTYSYLKLEQSSNETASRRGKGSREGY